MKHKTWFRLVLKAIGVLRFVMSFPNLLGVGVQVGLALMDFTPFSGAMDMLFWQIPQGVGYLISCIFSLYLFFRGDWFVNKATPSNRPYCPECGYDLSKSRGERCPECGVTLPHDAAAPSNPV